MVVHALIVRTVWQEDFFLKIKQRISLAMKRGFSHPYTLSSVEGLEKWA